MKTRLSFFLLACTMGLAPEFFLLPAQPAETTPEIQNLPDIIPDDSASDWVVDRFAGNSTAGPKFFQGPAREVGGLGRCGACALPDGRVLIPFHGGLAEVDTNGTLRLVSEEDVIFATTGQVTANVAAYNPKDKHVYVPGANCIRRLIEREDSPWQLDLVAGQPGVSGFADGPAKAATFGRIDCLAINRRGTIFVLEGNQRIRLIENGQVSTLTSAVRAGGGLVDGPIKQARFSMIGLGGNLCLGEYDDTLYLSDHWNFAVRRIDLKTMTVTTVAGLPKPKKGDGENLREKRYNRNCDGPALTWASFNSGCAYVCWDPVHKNLWCGGPDENRFRWLRNGELRTVIGLKADKWPLDGINIPAQGVRMSWNAVVEVDAQGRAYLSCSAEPNGVWRAYNKKEVAP